MNSVFIDLHYIPMGFHSVGVVAKTNVTGGAMAHNTVCLLNPYYSTAR
jgi:hypothetical protein